jgi:hypothetical protein
MGGWILRDAQRLHDVLIEQTGHTSPFEHEDMLSALNTCERTRARRTEPVLTLDEARAIDCADPPIAWTEDDLEVAQFVYFSNQVSGARRLALYRDDCAREAVRATVARVRALFRTEQVNGLSADVGPDGPHLSYVLDTIEREANTRKL